MLHFWHLTSLLPRQTYKFSGCSFSEMALTNFEVPTCLFHKTGGLTMHIGWPQTYELRQSSCFSLWSS